MSFNLSALAVRERAVTFLYRSVGGCRRLRLRQAGTSRGSILYDQDYDGTSVWPGATAREMQDLVAEPLEKRLQELTLVRPCRDHDATWLTPSLP